MIDPVCIFHMLRRSQHECIYCCLCFETKTRDELSTDESGSLVDVCKKCAEQEKERESELASEV